MAEPSNEIDSDLSAKIQNSCNPNTGQYQYSSGCSVSNIAGDNSEMQPSNAHERHGLSEKIQGYHEANSQDQFDEAHETAAKSHASPCQHSPWGCVRCNSLPFLNSPFQPTDAFYSNKMSYSTNQIEMRINASPIGQARLSRQYTAALLSSPGNQGNTALQYANMQSLEQQNALFRHSTTPTLSHQSTPQSLFSAPRTSPNTGQIPYDWGTPATTVSFSFKGHNSNNAAPSGQSEMYEVSSADDSKTAEGFDVQLISDAGNDNQQWLQDAELDDLNYRRGSQSAVIHLQGQKQNFGQATADVIDFMAPANLSVADNEKQLSNHEYMRPTYVNSEPILGQQYLPFEQRTFNTMGLEFNNPFAVNTNMNLYDMHPTYNRVDSYGAFDLSTPLYQSANYSLPSAIIPSQNFTVESDVKQPSRGGPSRSRHNVRDEDMDRKLVAWRDSGMSYKEIMQKGKFGLEESTLRGRYRTLTKSKDKRLRKPVWDDHAVSLRGIH